MELPEYVTCVCQDGRKASLLDCVRLGWGSSKHDQEVVYSAQAFPHFVALGPRHYRAEELSVANFSFHLSGAEGLFFDIEPWIPPDREIRHDDASDYSRTFGFYGPGVIFEADTAIGRVSAYHAPSFKGPSMSGFSAENQVRVSVEPSSPICIREVIDITYRIRCFAEVCSGQSQSVADVSFVSIDELPTGHTVTSDLLISHSEDGVKRDRYATGYDMLAAPCLNREDFESLVMNWFAECSSHRHVSLSRFSSNLRNDSYYDANRLVSAASLFEWFDSSRKVELPADIAFVIDRTKRALSSLPNTDVRDRLLGALGRARAETLKLKMERLLDGVLDDLSAYDSFDRGKAERVVALAVRCRNALVHGGTDERTRTLLEEYQVFLTDTLEILFACLCLHSYGWKIRREDERHLRGHTRYATFLREFDDRADNVIGDADG